MFLAVTKMEIWVLGFLRFLLNGLWNMSIIVGVDQYWVKGLAQKASKKPKN